MIESPQTLFPIVRLSNADDWKDLKTACEPHLDQRGLTRLKRALAASTKMVLVERGYIDKDYRDTFSHFHSKKFVTPDSRCLRLHFFNKDLPAASLEDAAVLQPAYSGYSVIRPTAPNCIGRTLLNPQSRPGLKGTAMLCREKVNLRGIELDVEGFPFISQDADVTVCAQSALWMLLRYFSNRFHVYPEMYPFQISNLTRDYSIGRLYPSRGLFEWQMTEAMRQAGLAPVQYSRKSRENDFEDLMYTYIESGFPLLVSTDGHSLVAFGHVSDYADEKEPPPQPLDFSSRFNRGFVVNDDGKAPYELVLRSGLGLGNESDIRLSQIQSFIAPLPEKVFLTAEGFRDVVTSLTTKVRTEDSPDFRMATLSPILGKAGVTARLFLTTGRSFKQRIRDRGMGHPEVARYYLNLPLPHFIWVCELSTHDLYQREHRVWGEVLWDATRNDKEYQAFLAVHYPEVLLIDVGAGANRPQKIRKKLLDNPAPYPLFRHNLRELDIHAGT